MKERQERFGIETKESVDAKKQERMKRFANMEEAGQSGITSEELEAKRKARMERFGEAEVKEAQKSAGGKDGFKLNRRKNKMNQKQGQNGDRNGNKD